jgi:hypothetical protein
MMAEQFNGRAPPTFERLDAISRTRALTPAETLRLERVLRRCGEPKGQRLWTRSDISRLRRYLLRGKKPKQIAPLLNRTERAVWCRMRMLGWTVRAAGKKAIAIPPGKP